MVSRFDFTVGSVEATVIGRAVDADIRRFPLRISPTTIDPIRFAKLARRVYTDLEARRLSVDGELHRQVRLAFELLGQHRVSVAVSGSDVHLGEIAVLAATDGAQALTITQADSADPLHFSLFPDEDLVQVLADTLPLLDPAPTGPLSVEQRDGRPRSAMAARRKAEQEFDDEETEAFGNIQVGQVLRARTARPVQSGTDAELLEEILAEPRLGGGYFTAGGFGRHGDRRTAPPVTWLDTEAGRYLVQTSTDGTGTLTARYVPAGTADVADAVQRTISVVY
jgi:hypothetical protein